MVPVTGFALGTWQVYRRNWKLDLIEKYEARLDMPPAILPPNLDATKAEEFDHRRILMKGHFLHDQEMLIGPRQWNGETGFHVITPFQRDDGTRVLVNRGWIPRARADKSTRPKGLVGGEVVIEGLVRPAPGKGYFQNENEPHRGLFYYLNLEEMGGMVDADQGFFVEEIFDPNRSWSDKFIVDGKPIGRVPQVNLKNNHMQYIITWYSLGVITSFMLFRLMRQPANRVKMRVKAA
ncbi:surf-like protein [Saitoella coloradoensis]